MDAVKIGPNRAFRAGPHLIVCGDLQEDWPRAKVLEAGTPDLIYTDPPWNVNLLKGFRTRAKLPPKKLSFNLFLNRLMELSAPAKGPAFFEMSNTTRGLFEDAASRAGGKVTHRWGITYFGDKPGAMIRVTWGRDPALEESPEGMDDDDTPLWVIERQSSEGHLVADFCMGHGLTLKSAHKLGRRFVGIELSPKRVVSALSWCDKQGLEVTEA